MNVAVGVSAGSGVFVMEDVEVGEVVSLGCGVLVAVGENVGVAVCKAESGVIVGVDVPVGVTLVLMVYVSTGRLVRE